jgi:hypothetical protein
MDRHAEVHRDRIDTEALVSIQVGSHRGSLTAWRLIEAGVAARRDVRCLFAASAAHPLDLPGRAIPEQFAWCSAPAAGVAPGAKREGRPAVWRRGRPPSAYLRPFSLEMILHQPLAALGGAQGSAALGTAAAPRARNTLFMRRM